MTPAPAPAPSSEPPAHRRRGGWMGLAVVLVVVLGGQQAWTEWRSWRAAQAIKPLAASADITLYTTSTCPYCAKARAWMGDHGIPWRECNVETDAACTAQYVAQGAPGVPLVRARGRWHLGFDPEWLAQTLSGVQPDVTREPQSSPSRDSSPRP